MPANVPLGEPSASAAKAPARASGLVPSGGAPTASHPASNAASPAASPASASAVADAQKAA